MKPPPWMCTFVALWDPAQSHLSMIQTYKSSLTALQNETASVGVGGKVAVHEEEDLKFLSSAGTQGTSGDDKKQNDGITKAEARQLINQAQQQNKEEFNKIVNNLKTEMLTPAELDTKMNQLKENMQEDILQQAKEESKRLADSAKTDAIDSATTKVNEMKDDLQKNITAAKLEMQKGLISQNSKIEQAQAAAINQAREIVKQQEKCDNQGSSWHDFYKSLSTFSSGACAGKCVLNQGDQEAPECLIGCCSQFRATDASCGGGGCEEVTAEMESSYAQIRNRARATARALQQQQEECDNQDDEWKSESQRFPWVKDGPCKDQCVLNQKLDHESPKCLIGCCYQEMADHPTCDGGDCNQYSSNGPACDSGGCNQIRSAEPTCSGGECDQKDASVVDHRPACDGGGCSQCNLRFEDGAAFDTACLGGDCTDSCEMDSDIQQQINTLADTKLNKNEFGFAMKQQEKCDNQDAGWRDIYESLSTFSSGACAGKCVLNQRDQKSPKCLIGCCSQVGATDASCDGGGCEEVTAEMGSLLLQQEECDHQDDEWKSESQTFPWVRDLETAVSPCKGKCVLDQQGQQSPTCLIGCCKQDGATNPSCPGGDCYQYQSESPTCSGGGCDQFYAVEPTCSGGDCYQGFADHPTCAGGNCDQRSSIWPACDGGGCDQSGNTMNPNCDGGECTQCYDAFFEDDVAVENKCLGRGCTFASC